MASPIKVLVLADLHIGSEFALWPLDFKLPGGGTYIPSEPQQWLHENVWQNIVNATPKTLDAIIYNGDLIDGGNSKDPGEERILTNTSFQRRAFRELFSPLLERTPPDDKGYKQIYVTQGTRYHETVSDMETLAESIKACPKFDKDGKPIRFCHPYCAVEFDGVWIEARHKISGAWIYFLSSLEREHNLERLASGEKGYVADVSLGSHRHKYKYGGGWDSYGHWEAISTPAIELLTDWAKRTNLNAWWPDLGAIMLYIYPQYKKMGRRAVFHEAIRVPHPPPQEVFRWTANLKER